MDDVFVIFIFSSCCCCSVVVVIAVEESHVILTVSECVWFRGFTL